MKETNPVITLQENASNFFEKVYVKNIGQMQCKQGCSKCCQTDISIFEVEAERVREWFSCLSLEKRNSLYKIWHDDGDKQNCVFLANDSCTIYEARPLICRTQGLPLYLSSENSLDYCGLNFEKCDPDKSDWLNLERMNTLLSIAAKSIKKDQRIRLLKLKKQLLSL